MVRSAFDWVRRPLGWVTFGDDSDQACACAPPPAAAIAAPPAAADPMPDVSEVGAGAAGKGASACAWLLDDISSIARARGEGRVFDIHVEAQKAASITFDKEPNSSPTESDFTTTEESIATDGDGDSIASAPAPLPPRNATLDAVAARLAAEVSVTAPAACPPWSPTSHRSSLSELSEEGSGSGSGRNSRRRKKPPSGLPPTCLVGDNLPMVAQPVRRASQQHLQSWCSAPVLTPLNDERPAIRAAETQRRADWVEDSVFAV